MFLFSSRSNVAILARFGCYCVFRFRTTISAAHWQRVARIDEEVRLETLERLKILDTAAEASFDNLVTLAGQLCNTPIALVSLIDKDRQWFKARVGLDAESTPRSISFCGHALAREGDEADALFEVPDAAADRRFAGNPLVTGAPDIRFYAGQPLHASNGAPLGTLCVIDRQPKQLSDTQRQLLALLAKQVEAEIELRYATQTGELAL